MIRACSRSRVTRTQGDKAEAAGDVADRTTTGEAEEITEVSPFWDDDEMGFPKAWETL